MEGMATILRGAASLALAVALAGGTVAACSDADDAVVPTAVDGPGSAPGREAPAAGTRTTTGDASAAATADASTTPTVAASTTTTLVRTPTAIEATLVDPATVWPAATAGAPPVSTRTTFADGTDNQLLAAIYQPTLPAVPHATIATNGGAVVERVSGFEFAEAAAADAWVATWAPYSADEVADLPGAVHVERHPLAPSTPGWNGFVVDAVYEREGGALWQRTASLVRGAGVRAYTVSVRWFGDPSAGVPDLGTDVAALAGAQDAFLGRSLIGPATPGTGAGGGLARLGLTERAAPWASLLALPDIDVNAGVQVLEAASPDALPAGAAGARAIAARVACGERGCPVFSVVTAFPDAASASAAAVRWTQGDALLGPLDEVAIAPVPGSTGAALSNVALVDASAVAEASALTATLSDGVTSYQVGAGWFVRGDTVYGAFTVYPSVTRNAEAVVSLLRDHAARLAALGG